MAGICSRHHPDIKVENCPACNSTPADVMGEEEYQQLKENAIKAGVHQCHNCGFAYYKTTNICPLCSAPLKLSFMKRLKIFIKKIKYELLGQYQQILDDNRYKSSK